MAIGGTYSIDSYSFPAPVTAWNQRPIGAGLDGFPIYSSYWVHEWTWDFLSAEDAINLYSLLETQQSSRTQLSSLETDAHDASLSNSAYGTQTYSNFYIQGISERRRGYPHYENVSIVFEVYIS